ncbi:hypothetical protein EWB00_000375 [Schistosoma japonicum]|uniref:Uncharacterized protein n=1 Tax=Schistosoma japonicum TaxID=6182 RepID=C1LKN3_SCHJA|nr:hypothetical protein EWB00_000375 [Schistosoma japonicum]CAX75261.1 hypothetical protein [Schistosoma japonicum]
MTTPSETVCFDIISNGENFHLEGRLCSLSAFSHVSKHRNLPRERTYFNSPTKTYGDTCVYDLVFAKEDDFNPKLHRCDRRHDKHFGLNVNKEEETKTVPTLSSSIYGYRLNRNIERNDRKHARIMLVESEFYRRNGIDLL